MNTMQLYVPGTNEPIDFFFWKTHYNPGVCTNILIHENQEQIVIKKGKRPF